MCWMDSRLFLSESENTNVGSHVLVIQHFFVLVKLIYLHVSCKLLQGAFAVYTYMYFFVVVSSLKFAL